MLLSPGTTPRFLRLAAASMLLATAGCGSQGSEQSLPTASISSRAGAARKPAGNSLHPVVRLSTTVGEITLKLDAELAPGTVRNFLDYVNEGFYAGTTFHYVDPDQMILGGGYTANGQLKPTRLSIRNEAHNGLKNVRGSVAMARDASLIDSATSQFFINLVDTPSLDFVDESAENYGYCVFGEVIDGLETAERISRVATTSRSGDLAQTPATPVVIQSIAVIQ